MEKEYSEKELLLHLNNIINIDLKNKIVNISDDILLKLTENEMFYLLYLKKYKYSLQYIIE